MNEVTILKQAKEILDSPEKLCKEAYARDWRGRKLGAGYHKDACCYCVIGAIEKVIGQDLIMQSFSSPNIVNKVDDILVECAQKYFEFDKNDYLTTFIDSLSYNQVIQLLDYSIEYANENITN